MASKKGAQADMSSKRIGNAQANAGANERSDHGHVHENTRSNAASENTSYCTLFARLQGYALLVSLQAQRAPLESAMMKLVMLFWLLAVRIAFRLANGTCFSSSHVRLWIYVE